MQVYSFDSSHTFSRFEHQVPPTKEMPPLNPLKIDADLSLYLPFCVASSACINFHAAVKARDINAFHLGQKYIIECTPP